MKHLKFLRTLNFIMGAFSVLGGGIALAIWFLTKQLDPGSFGLSTFWFTVLGICGFLLLLLWGALHITTGFLVGAGRGRAWQTLLAVTHVASFPLGTAYALYAAWVCWLNPASKKKFDAKLKGYIA